MLLKKFDTIFDTQECNMYKRDTKTKILNDIYFISQSQTKYKNKSSLWIFKNQILTSIKFLVFKK